MIGAILYILGATSYQKGTGLSAHYGVHLNRSLTLRLSLALKIQQKYSQNVTMLIY
jgi:hypothetical protein